MTDKYKGPKNTVACAYDAGLAKRAPLQLKITQIGNSLGVILPKELLSKLDVEKGDTVFVSEAPDGFNLSAYDPEIAEELALGRDIMRQYRDTLRALAK
jgi:putative addiction module antidote